MAKITKDKIIEFLNERGVYEEVDDYIIEQFLYNLELIKICQADIAVNGIKVPKNEAETLFLMNPAVLAYQAAMNQVVTLGSKMGLSHKSRKELDLLLVEEEDDF